MLFKCLLPSTSSFKQEVTEVTEQGALCCLSCLLFKSDLVAGLCQPLTLQSAIENLQSAILETAPRSRRKRRRSAVSGTAREERYGAGAVGRVARYLGICNSRPKSYTRTHPARPRSPSATSSGPSGGRATFNHRTRPDAWRFQVQRDL